MKALVTFLFLSLTSFSINAQNTSEVIYVIPGFATDGRIYEHFDPGCEVVVLEHFEASKNETMAQYAERMADCIDTTRTFSLVGCSLGGMLAVEMNNYINPEYTFLVASAARQSELPMRYRSFRYLPIHKVVGGKGMQKLSKLGRILFEPKAKAGEDLFADMITQKSPNFLLWAVEAIARWENETVPENVIHIHGGKDHVIPMRNIPEGYFIREGSHTMMYFFGEEISEIVKQY